MTDKPYGEMTTPELISKMQGNPVQSLPYIEMNGELSRRVANSQLEASAAQVRSARLQFAAVIAMFLAVVATVAVPWLSHLWPS
jgi:hypothetical protein